MIKHFYEYYITVLVFLSGCHYAQEQKLPTPVINEFAAEVKDTSLLYLDSSLVVGFIEQHPEINNDQERLAGFYFKRNYCFAWINSAGLNEYANNFINLLKHERSTSATDTTFYNQKLMQLIDTVSVEEYSLNEKDTETVELELLLTCDFFSYALRNWKGIGDEGLQKAEWFIERKKLNYAGLLDTLLKSNSNAIGTYEPVYRQYGLLKNQLQRYVDVSRSGEWPLLNDEVKSLEIGNSDSSIIKIKKALFLTGDLLQRDSSNLFNEELKNAVEQFQSRNGIKEDGIISGITYKELQVSLQDRIEQILINMERCRWVPVQLKGDYLAVNIPDYKLYVYDSDTLKWSCNVVVGKTTNATVIFNDNLQYIVFSPYWNIPASIITKETLPAVKRNRNYLSSHNMEVVDASGKLIPTSSIDWGKYSVNKFPYIIRQKPGKNNSLGLVKFLFPNSYGIYLHDTPAKSLFGENKRAFSHGCIRVQEPAKLAQYLLRNDESWDDKKIDAAMHGSKETFVKLKNKVPVFIAYFTAWVDMDGKLNFRDDIYGHDAKMKKLLFSSDEKGGVTISN